MVTAAVIAALVFGMAGTTLGVIGLTRTDNDGGATSALAALKVSVAQLKNQAGLMDTTAIQSELHRLAMCVPQIQSQIDGLNVNSDYYTNVLGINGQIAQYPVTLQNSTIVSQDCQPVLRPRSDH